MGRPRTSSSRHLEAWLDEHIRSCAPGERLPTDTQLASRFGLSRKTVERTMKRTATSGRLIRVRGSGTYVPPGPGAAEEIPVRTDAVASMASALETAVASGDYPWGTALPTLDAMVRHYHVSRTTATRACRVLAERGLVTRIGRRYWCGNPAPPEAARRPREVVLFSDNPEQMNTVFADTAYGTAYRACEDVLARMGYRVRYALLGDLGTMCRQWRRTRLFPYGILLSDFAASGTVAAEDVFGSSGLGPALGQCPVLVDLRGAVFSHADPASHLRIRSGKVTFMYRPLLGRLQREALARFVHARPYRAVRFVLRHQNLSGKSGRRRGADAAGQWLPPFWVLPDILEFSDMLRAAGKGCICDVVVIGGEDPSRRSELAERMQRQIGSGHTANSTVVGDAREVPGSQPGTLTVCRTDEIAATVLTHHGQGDGLVSLDNNPSYFHLGLSRCGIDWHGLGHLMAHAVTGTATVPTMDNGYLRPRAEIIQKRTT